MRKILIIDDDEVQLMLQRSLLVKEGYTVYTTADGPQGITLFRAHRPDLVLLDIGLPTLSGIEVLKEIRRLDDRAKVIVITGYASVESAVLALRCGAADYVRKPYDVPALVAKVGHVLAAIGE